MQKDRYPLIVPVTSGTLPGETVRRWAQMHEVFCVLDGCDETTRKAWEEIPGILLMHHIPLGLGRSLKTGMNAVLEQGDAQNGVILLLGDCPELPLAEAFAAMQRDSRCVCAGTGEGRDGKNRLFSLLTSIVGGASRSLPMDVLFLGIPAGFCAQAVTLPGEGDACLADFVLSFKKQGLSLAGFPLAAKSTRPLRVGFLDWLRMFIVAASFVLSSAASFLVDYGLFALLFYPLGINRTWSTVIARILSSVVNFTLNRSVVFQSQGRRGSLWVEVAQYYALVAVVLGLNVLILGLFNEILGIPVLLAKLITEMILFVFNYFVQRDLIFREVKKKQG